MDAIDKALQESAEQISHQTGGGLNCLPNCPACAAALKGKLLLFKQLVAEMEQLGCACDLLYGNAPCCIHGKARQLLTVIDSL